MMIFVVTLFIFLIVIGVLLWVKHPHYQMTKADVIALLQNVLVGQASENDWAIFLSSSFRHAPQLEVIRDECASIDEREYIGQSRSGFLFTDAGLEELKRVLVRVQCIS